MRKKLRIFFANISTVISMWMLYTMNALADLKITPDITVDDFNNLTGDTVESTVLWIVFFILRLVGVIVLIWGIYGYLTAKKDGEADQINVAMTKVIFGSYFLCMPWILSKIGVIATN